MNRSRLEHINQQYRKIREKHDTAMQIGDYFSLPILQDAYNRTAKERNWLDDLDTAMFFPHVWDSWEEASVYRISVTILWPDMSVKTPLETREIVHGGLMFSYNDRDLDNPKFKHNIPWMFINQNNLNDIFTVCEEANNILKWYSKDSPAFPHLVKQLAGASIEETDKIARPWLDDDANMIDSLDHCRERAQARNVWDDACKLVFRTMAKGASECEWDLHEEDVFTVKE